MAREVIRLVNNLGQVVTVTVEGVPTRAGELAACARYLAECLGATTQDGAAQVGHAVTMTVDKHD